MGKGQELLDAAREGDKKIVEKILAQITKRSGPFTSLRRGAGVNVQDDNGYTPLHHACLRGHKEIVRLLLSVDASPCIVDKKGATALHLAAWKGDSDVVSMLLSHANPAVNIDQLTSEQETALLIAAQFGNVDVVAQLLARGADVTVRNIKDESALDLAAQYGRLETVQHLLRARPQLVDSYRFPVCRGRLFSSTPLHRASKNGHKEVVSTLIGAGIDPNVRTYSGTALHEAANYGKASVVRILLAKGADLNAADRRGKTVHDLLNEYSEEATKRVRRIIREHMATSGYESEEDLPPFPVQDYSPTGYPSTVGMEAPETQKNNKSLSSSSILTKNQPPSLVKRLANKCLGIKAKFSSAPNISNNPELGVAVTSKNALKKSSTNTKLIGNSKFFDFLQSNKEEVGEVVCNDEFDTVSLGRQSTLDRSATVNRSNRSCPGFKTSLPNISENAELSDSRDSQGSIVIIELDNENNYKRDKVKTTTEAINHHHPKLSIFEPRDDNNDTLHRKSNTSAESDIVVNECYEPYEVKITNSIEKVDLIPKPPPRPTVTLRKTSGDAKTYENIEVPNKVIVSRSAPSVPAAINLRVAPPIPAARTHIIHKVNAAENKTVYENITPKPEVRNNPAFIPNVKTNSEKKVVPKPEARQKPELIPDVTTLQSEQKVESKNLTPKLEVLQKPELTPDVTTLESEKKKQVQEYKNLTPKPEVLQNPELKRKLSSGIENKIEYENILPKIEVNQIPEPPKRTILPVKATESFDKSPTVSRSSTLSSGSLTDEANFEDILLSSRSKSFKHGKNLSEYTCTSKSQVQRSQSITSDSSNITEASALDNVDVSAELDEKSMYLSMTGTMPNKKTERAVKKKVLFRHKTFTNIEVGTNSVHTDFPKWNNDFMKETLANYHIRGTGHCIYQAPTVEEFIYIFNRDTLYSDVKPFEKVPNNKRESYFETAICFCKPKPPKFHKSAEDLLEIPPQDEEKVTINLDALRSRNEMHTTSFQCFCDDGSCKFHEKKRELPINNLVVKFSAIKKSISTPDITLATTPPSTTSKSNLPKNKSVPCLEEPYAVIDLKDVISRKKSNDSDSKDACSVTYSTMSHPSTVSTGSRPYSIKDIAEEISLREASLSSNASDVIRFIRQTSSSEHSGQWSLHTCNSNATVKSDMSFRSCEQEFDSSDDDDETLHSDDDDSDADTVASVSKRPWVHSDSFRFDNKESEEVIPEEPSEDSDVDLREELSDIKKTSINNNSFKFDNIKGSKIIPEETSNESGIETSEELSPNASKVDVDELVSGALVASLESGSGVGRVRSGSGRRRWDEAEGTSEGDALSVSSAASSCAPHHLAHHHDFSKVSPTPPKKPPRRNLSVSPTHANSPSSGYSYELRTHARSQDDLDDIQGAKHYLKHGRSVDQYVDGKLSYSEYEENHNSPRVAPIPNPRPSLKNRPQPVAITAMYENVVIKEQNPRRKLRRNNFGPQYESSEPRMNETRVRKYSAQERSSLESLLDDSQSMNSPSDCERYYDGPRVEIPLSPTHYEAPPTPDHPPPSAKQAENSIHERIRPLSQEYKRRSALRDSYTETEVNLLRAASAASVASGATDRSGNTDNCVEEFVCDVPFAGLFKGSTTTLDGIGLRPMPAERPKTLRKLKSVYDSSPTELPGSNHTNTTSNGQVQERINGVEDEVRRRSNTTSSNQSGDKSLSILSPFDEQEEWAKISEIMASFGSKLVRESVFVSELEQEFTSRLGLSCSESSLSPSVASTLGLWLSGLGLHDYEPLFTESGFDDVDFINGVIDDGDLKEMGIEEADRIKILESTKQLPLKIAEISNNHNNNNISKNNQTETVDEWLKDINLEQYTDTFRKHLYVDMDRVRRIWEVELTAVLEIQKAGHRKRILASVSGQQNGPASHLEDINADLNTLKNNIKQLKEEIKEKLPSNISENLKPVPPPVVPTLAPPGGETLKRSKKNRPAPQPPRPSDLEIRNPSELLVGVPGALKTQWKHQPFVLVTGAVTYVANYLGSTVVKELRGTESTKKSIQKLKKSTKEPRDSPDIILSISYRGVKFLNTITRELICEHEIRNIHCACQDADDLTHFAYITKDHATKSHFCHVFSVATMDQATEVILTLGEAFEVAYQMALREQSNRVRVPPVQAKTPTHDPMTTTNKEKPNINHGRSHSITEIKLNGHQLKLTPIPASLSNEDFQATRSTDGSRSPRTPLLKAPIASTEEL